MSVAAGNGIEFPPAAVGATTSTDAAEGQSGDSSPPSAIAAPPGSQNGIVTTGKGNRAPKNTAAGGKPRCISNSFVDIYADSRGRKMAREKCRPTADYRLRNVCRSKAHMLKCSNFARNFPAAFEDLVRRSSGNAVADDLRRRRVEAAVNPEAVMGAQASQPVVTARSPKERNGLHSMLPYRCDICLPT